MVYHIQHKRKVVGTQIHDTLSSKLAKRQKLGDDDIEGLYQSDLRNLKKIKAELEQEKVESEYLVPEIKDWVETDSVKSIKGRVKNWLTLKYPVHIIGPTGCGKTILALQVAKELGRPVVWLNGDESIATTDLIGGYSQVEVSTIRDKYIHNVYKDKEILKAEWLDNPLTLACKYGYTLVYNEFARSRAVANNVLLSIFSEGILELPTKFGEERYVKVHPEFRVIFTSNSIEYAGVHRAQDALLDRMVGIYMDYYNRETEAKIISAHSKIDEKHAILIADMLNSVREELQEDSCLGTRAGVMIAHALMSLGKFDRATIRELFADVITSKTKNIEHFREQMKIIEKL
ncbi:MAG: gas vesicle protein GvpN [Nanoarchaeota archaeon]